MALVRKQRGIVLISSLPSTTFRGFTAYRNKSESGWKAGGQSGHVTEKEHFCSLDIELVSVGLHLYYIPRGCLTHHLVGCLYPRSANRATPGTSSTLLLTSDSVSQCIFITSRDFNYVTLGTLLSETYFLAFHISLFISCVELLLIHSCFYFYTFILFTYSFLTGCNKTISL